MGVVLFIAVAVIALGVLAGSHLYMWRRFVRDVSRPRSRWRRLGTALAVLLPATTFATLLTSRSGAPFALQQALAWPGYLWLACVLYLTLALLAAELIRFVLRCTAWGRPRAASRRGPAPAPALSAARSGSPAKPARTEPKPEAKPKPEPEAEPEPEAVGASAAPAGETPATAAGSAVPAGEPAPAGGGAVTAPAPPAPASAAPSAGEASRTTPPGRPAPSRRVFLARTLATAAGAAGLGTTAAGAYSVLNGPTLKNITVPLAKLGRRAHGYRIAVVSDIHLGPILGKAHTQRIVDTINRAQPDLVTIVGDLVDGSVADLGPAAEPLRQLRSRHGAYFVTGNHEYFGNADEWVAHLRELNVHPLENARRELPGFDLAGVNDIAGEEQGEGPDYRKALGDRDTSRAAVLMAHQPVMIHEAVDHDVDLQLSGHTHGGQLWPGPYLAELANPTVAGLERYGDTQLYVTRGAGAWGPPVRVGAESDVTLVHLASKQS
ncbi:metallophosphoesterase [Streptomyces axinellae]|uniref:Calcineurin-like phosphoesterase domain-containing protein n=1 Tax=Streptomyces axinellae TaxID=552788 RepID=A0ABP6D4T1_9ACTN